MSIATEVLIQNLKARIEYLEKKASDLEQFKARFEKQVADLAARFERKAR